MFSVGLLATNVVWFVVSPRVPLCDPVRSGGGRRGDGPQQLSGRLQKQQLQSKTQSVTFSSLFSSVFQDLPFLFPVSAFTSLQLTPGRSYRAANGLLGPPAEEPVRASQSSLCDILQEKEKKTSTSTGTGTSLGLAAGAGPAGTAGTGMDHSALIHLRAKNFREKSDAHFVDVIREDR